LIVVIALDFTNGFHNRQGHRGLLKAAPSGPWSKSQLEVHGIPLAFGSLSRIDFPWQYAASPPGDLCTAEIGEEGTIFDANP